MKKAFLEKVKRLVHVETRRYSYWFDQVYSAGKSYDRIIRLPISELGTTSAISDWETVCVLKCTEAKNRFACAHCHVSGVCTCGHKCK